MKKGVGVLGSRTREEREARITKMMLIVFGCFLICYLPLFIYLGVSNFLKLDITEPDYAELQIFFNYILKIHVAFIS